MLVLAYILTWITIGPCFRFLPITGKSGTGGEWGGEDYTLSNYYNYYSSVPVDSFTMTKDKINHFTE